MSDAIRPATVSLARRVLATAALVAAAAAPAVIGAPAATAATAVPVAHTAYCWYPDGTPMYYPDGTAPPCNAW